MGKRAQLGVGKPRMMSASSKHSKLSKDTKTYYPEEYFKRVGYQKDQASNAEQRVDALGQRVRERFNEELDYGNAPSEGRGLNSRNIHKANKDSIDGKLKDGRSSISLSAASSKRFSTRKGVLDASRRSMKSNQFRGTLDDQADKASIITTDKLKKFNEIQGTEAGNLTQQLEEQAKELVEAQETNRERDDDVLQEGEENKDDVHQLAERKEKLSEASVPASYKSGASRLYISKLEKQLREEKDARLKLEAEIEEIKRVNAEISSKLALSGQSPSKA